MPYRRKNCFRRALLLAVFAAAVPSGALAAPWPTTAWTPVCSDTGQGDRYGDGGCDLNDPGVDVYLQQFSDGSEQYQAMGFRAPALEMAGIAQPAYVARFLDVSVTSSTGHPVGGYYGEELRRIYMNPMYFFTMGAAADENGSAVMYSAHHELFYAIQFAYLGVYHLLDLERWQWVVEGSAEAASMVLTGRATSDLGRPWLDSPLDDLRLRGTEGAAKYVAYPFWLYLADRHGGGLPGGFGVLHRIFDDLKNQTARSSSIAMIDGALRQLDKDGLYNIYPGFIAQHDDQEHYQNVIQVLTPGARDAVYTTTIDGHVDSMSAQAYLVKAIGVVAQRGRRASEVEIRIKADDPDSLHLIVGDTRYDESGANRNVYRASITGEALDELLTLQELLVRVVNVADEPENYRSQDFQLIVTVYHEYILVQGMSQPPGEAEPGGEAIGSAITTLDRMSGFLSPHGSPFASPDAGFAAPCLLRISFLDDGRNPTAISFAMDHEGPIVPGTYPIVSNPDGVRPENYPDQVIAGFTLGESNPLAGGFPQAYEAAGGVLTLSSVTPRWITGNARILGSLGRKVYTSGDTPPNGPNPLAIDVEFSVRNQVAHMGADRCAAFDG